MTTTANITDGECRKSGAHAVLTDRRELWILRGRRALLGKLLRDGRATADDVRTAVELPAGIGPKCLGPVPAPFARAGIIRRVGFTASTRAKSHARPVSVWELVDADAARQWLAGHPDRPDSVPQSGACDAGGQRLLFDAGQLGPEAQKPDAARRAGGNRFATEPAAFVVSGRRDGDTWR